MAHEIHPSEPLHIREDGIVCDSAGLPISRSAVLELIQTLQHAYFDISPGQSQGIHDERLRELDPDYIAQSRRGVEDFT